MKCSKSCQYLVKIYLETGNYYTEEGVAEQNAKKLGLEVQDRPSGFYLVSHNGYKCSNYCCRSYNKYVNINDDCDAEYKITCDGQLRFI